jgi:Tol biopolymer transport system component
VAFASDRTGDPQIYLVNVDGTGLEQLTNVADGACQPSWTPDGLRLAFTSPCRKNQDTYPGAGIWVMEVDGSRLEPLPTEPGGDFDPSWGPDGERIAFTSLRNGRPQIHVFNPETNELERLTGDFEFEGEPEWSPDGRRSPSERTERRAATLPDAAATGRRHAWLRSTDPDSGPQWSPDGMSILPRAVGRRSPDGDPLRRLQAGIRICAEGFSVQPMAAVTWSPDGR